MSAMTHSPDSIANHSALPSDRDLLRRFIHDGDEASFAAIVERHATLVMSVCRRVIGQTPDVDDAFQATFFALSQRPAGIYECLSLSGWLYSVAWRASVRLVRLRKRTMTQPLPEQLPAAEPDPLDAIAQASELATLDEELNQLPQKFRDVLVMSYFAQQTNQEIADQLNESKGAIDGRIRDARRMLRVRLARRGVEVSVLALATAYVQSSASAASPALIQKTICLGTPGIVSQELVATNAAEVAHLKLLTSTGISLMNKFGLTIAAGLVLTTGLWGMTHSAAFQDAVGGGEVTAAGGDAVATGEIVSELAGRTEATETADSLGGTNVTVSGASSVASRLSTEPASKTSVAKPQRPKTRDVAEFSRRSDREFEQLMNVMMQTKIAREFNFPGTNPLTDILEQVSIDSGFADEGVNGIKPDIGALNDDSIVIQDVMISDVDIREGSMTVGSFLDHVLSQTDPQLTWIVRDGLLLITTTTAAESEENMLLRSYDISRLRKIIWPSTSDWNLESGQAGGGMGGGGFGFGFGGGAFSMVPEPLQSGGSRVPAGAPTERIPTTDASPEKSTPETSRSGTVMSWEGHLTQTLLELTQQQCHWYDFDGEGGQMNIFGNRLIVRQSRKGHEHVVAVLEQLELAVQDLDEEE